MKYNFGVILETGKMQNSKYLFKITLRPTVIIWIALSIRLARSSCWGKRSEDSAGETKESR